VPAYCRDRSLSHHDLTYFGTRTAPVQYRTFIDRFRTHAHVHTNNHLGRQWRLKSVLLVHPYSIPRGPSPHVQKFPPHRRHAGAVFWWCSSLQLHTQVCSCLFVYVLCVCAPFLSVSLFLGFSLSLSLSVDLSGFVKLYVFHMYTHALLHNTNHICIHIHL